MTPRRKATEISDATAAPVTPYLAMSASDNPKFTCAAVKLSHNNTPRGPELPGAGEGGQGRRTRVRAQDKDVGALESAVHEVGRADRQRELHETGVTGRAQRLPQAAAPEDGARAHAGDGEQHERRRTV